MITPRRTRLLRVPDLRALQRTLAGLVPPGLDARSSAIVVPTRSAAGQLRRTLENLTLSAEPGRAFVAPDLVTRGGLYERLHLRLPMAPPLLTVFERDVLLRLAAEDAQQGGLEPPFRLRPGLLSSMLEFYDELRRRGRTIDSLDRNIRAPLAAGCETDRGAARLLAQTDFLSATFAAFERRIGDSGRLDEHALRALILSGPLSPPYRHLVLAVADRAAEPGGVWPVDLDLLARMPGLERLDIVATEAVLASGWHARLGDALPEIDEVRAGEALAPPRLLAPECPAAAEQVWHVVCRDREEELAQAARWIKRRAREVRPAPALDRTAIVFQRPLPYLYLARTVLPSAAVPYEALDALPLAAEPFAAAIDVVFAAVLEDASRTTIVELLASPHWRFVDPAQPERELSRSEIAALDRALQESKYLGGWDRLEDLAGRVGSLAGRASRESGRWRRAAAPLRAAAALAPRVRALHAAERTSAQVGWMLELVRSCERPADDPRLRERHLRARAAVLGALSSLGLAHQRYDDRPTPLPELVATVRRWIESQTFAPRTGTDGVLLLDAAAARFADVDAARIIGLVESDWPEPSTGSIFYPTNLLREIGWNADGDRVAAGRAAFQDLLRLPAEQVSVSAFTLEEDALVPPSPFLEDLGASGLPVDRAGDADEPRVFTHEALSMPPPAAAGLGEEAAGWLLLRQARTGALDARYRGSIGAHGAGIYAVSRVERYLECPFKYFAGHVLQLEEEREDESGLSAQERGQLLHGVFEAFFAAWRGAGQGAITTANLAEAVALFAEVTEARLAELSDADRALERTYLLGSAASPGLAERAFAFEIEHGVPVVERLLEYPLDGLFRFEGGDGARDVRLRGKADRIDLLADGTLRIIDYKLGRAPKTSRALQLPVYGVCAAQQLRGHLGREWSVGRAGYLAFREKNAFVDAGGRGTLDAALADGQQRLLQAIDRIEAGEFPPSPDEAWTCNRCGFPHVCRKDYVGDE